MPRVLSCLSPFRPGPPCDGEGIEIAYLRDFHSVVFAALPDHVHVEHRVVGNERKPRGLPDEGHDKRVPDFREVRLVLHVTVADVVDFLRPFRYEVHLRRVDKRMHAVRFLPADEAHEPHRTRAVRIRVRCLEINRNVIKCHVNSSQICCPQTSFPAFMPPFYNRRLSNRDGTKKI